MEDRDRRADLSLTMTSPGRSPAVVLREAARK
jgi:hypothetical protein